MLAPCKKSYDKSGQHIKKQRHYFLTNVCIVKAMFFLVIMYGYESWTIKKGWVPKNWCFWTVVLGEDSWESLGLKPVNPKGNQSWIFIGRTDATAEAPIIWPPDAKSQIIRKDPVSGKDWSRRRGWQRMRLLESITNSMDMSLSKLQETVKDRRPGVLQSMG